MTCRWKSSTKLIFAGAVVQLHLTCRDHCFAWFSSAKFISSKNMIIFLYGKEEPSKMCPDLNEWRLSSVGWGTPLDLGRYGNLVEAWIFLRASQFLQLYEIQVNYEDYCLIYFILYSFLKAFLMSSYDLLVLAYNHNIRVKLFLFFKLKVVPKHL